MSGSQPIEDLAARLRAVSWRPRPPRDPARARAALRGFLQASARWAVRLGLEAAWPFRLELAARLAPDAALPPERLDALLGDAARDAPTSRALARDALAFAAARDRPEVASFGLPDPYEPLLDVFEACGALVVEHGFIEIQGAGAVPVLDLSRFLGDVSEQGGAPPAGAPAEPRRIVEAHLIVLDLPATAGAESLSAAEARGLLEELGRAAAGPFEIGVFGVAAAPEAPRGASMAGAALAGLGVRYQAGAALGDVEEREGRAWCRAFARDLAERRGLPLRLALGLVAPTTDFVTAWRARAAYALAYEVTLRERSLSPLDDLLNVLAAGSASDLRRALPSPGERDAFCAFLNTAARLEIAAAHAERDGRTHPEMPGPPADVAGKRALLREGLARTAEARAATLSEEGRFLLERLQRELERIAEHPEVVSLRTPGWGSILDEWDYERPGDDAPAPPFPGRAALPPVSWRADDGLEPV